MQPTERFLTRTAVIDCLPSVSAQANLLRTAFREAALRAVDCLEIWTGPLPMVVEILRVHASGTLLYQQPPDVMFIAHTE